MFVHCFILILGDHCFARQDFLDLIYQAVCASKGGRVGSLVEDFLPPLAFAIAVFLLSQLFEFLLLTMMDN